MAPKEKAFEIYENIYRRTPLVLTEVYRHTSTRTISMYMINEIIATFNVDMDKDLISEWEQVKTELKKI